MSKETAFSGVVSIVGLIVNAFLGGWDIALQVMIFCMVVDYVTGVLGAIKKRDLSAEVMFWGGVKKAVIVIVVALAVMLDQLLGNESPVFRTLAIYFYVGREGLSIVENLGIIGVTLPSFLSKVLSQFEQDGDKK